MTNANTIRALMAEVLEQPAAELSDATPLDELPAGSFTLVEMIIALQEQVGVRFGQADMDGVKTVGELIALFVKRKEAAVS